MARALQLAEKGRHSTQPNPRVGCVIVRDGVIVGEGFHERAGEPHAEVHALRMAGDKARGADVFVTLEPCSHFGRTPPCADGLIAAGVRKVWAAMQDPNPEVAGKGLERLRAAGIEVESGLMHAQAQALNRGFVMRMTRGRPFVTLKLAASLDGRTAMANGESQWITSEAARADVHRLRAEAGAVLTSSATVLADDPELTVRHVETSRQPDRIVLDPRGRVSASAKVWNDGARRILLTAQSQSQSQLAKPAGVEVAQLDRYGEYFSMSAAMSELGRLKINEVLVECGPTLAGLLLQAEVVDELVLYLAPSLLGDAARPLARLPNLEKLSQRIALQWRDVRAVGPDLRLTAVPAATV
ncbi:bifunctional diaminohydroxyphosphoribosylaminopyrimidine deaminase/5-amino-6-(5-phosphoribosylamino)uracil reductase RibD [Stenotrophobium rhamnosiphilum]|uniref:Riboflavin biosynthesis protein RibD n=2 Tax=Stenotrophobium rhamnosiphilum TaxID=2029166 RepID=A0A2T5MIT9_9GAMM|nr:bifunctional diaminohydroxyphosphoribosylaminopyrimidine deaminase/5-amino-6-(5-phosphoribosylamino)uracil reductase RibD [Stenotrophobium rhamnosiphilum]